jgi:hypothetical protein
MTQRSRPSSLSSSLKQAQRVTSEMVSDLATGSRRMGSQLTTLGDVLAPAARGAATSKRTACCPPELLCPPDCMLTITRRAHPGEISLVPFKIRNPSGRSRTYKIGLRPLKDEYGKSAPSQPTLDRTSLQLAPREAGLVEMRLDLTSGYKMGQTFQTDIVVREEKYNQNICFTLHLEPFANVPIAEPIEEERLDVHFVSWDKHFYCDPHERRAKVGIRASETKTHD